jgi:hypothetical protein
MACNYHEIWKKGSDEFHNRSHSIEFLQVFDSRRPGYRWRTISSVPSTDHNIEISGNTQG